MKEIGSIGNIRVFVDNFINLDWVNIAKMGRIIKIRPEDVSTIVDLLIKAKEEIEHGGR